MGLKEPSDPDCDPPASPTAKRSSPSPGILPRLKHSSSVIVERRAMISLQQAICSGTGFFESCRKSRDFFRTGPRY
jgi:hypothetical protein